jgi:acyl carrier protein
MNPKKQEKIGVLRQIVVAVAIALLAGGTAPWWWKEISGKNTRDNTSSTITPTPSPPGVGFTPTPSQTNFSADYPVKPSPSIIASPTPMPLEYETRFSEIVGAALKISPDQVKPDHRLTSAERLQIMAAVRADFGLTDSAKEFSQLNTVGDVLQLIRSKRLGNKPQ